jgi:uncharacterized protein YjbI with pentapeptide repeats
MSIDEIAQDHLLWLQSAGQQGKRANFRGANLKGAVIKGHNFSQASFRNAQMHDTKFIECNLEEADFAEIDGLRAHFESCQLKLANFSRAELSHAVLLRCAMERSVFLQSILHHARFENVNLREANFREASMPEISFRHVELQKATLRAVAANNAHFTHVRFDGADIKETCFDASIFDHVIWDGANLRHARFDGAMAEQSDISRAKEVDATAVAAVEKSKAMQRERAYLSLEKDKQQLDATRTTLDQRVDSVKRRELLASKREQNLAELEQLLTGHQDDLKSHALLLRILAAGWWMVAAMIATIVVHQYANVGLSGLKLPELVILLGATLFLLALFTATAVMAYRASSRLWRSVDALDMLQDHKNA